MSTTETPSANSGNAGPGTAEAGTSPKISIRGLSKSFGDKHVLRSVDLDIAEGESLVIIGGSGTGKSVLIKNVIGLIPISDFYSQEESYNIPSLALICSFSMVLFILESRVSSRLAFKIHRTYSFR